MPAKYQHRVLFWGILGAIVLPRRDARRRRVPRRSGSLDLLHLRRLPRVAGRQALLREDDDDEDDGTDEALARARAAPVRARSSTAITAASSRVTINGRRALTTVAVCLVVIELTDIVFALDSIPAVLSVSQETFIMVTSNIFAILGLRSLYFVLAGAMAKFQYLKIALAVLLVVIGAKMIAHSHVRHRATLVSLARDRAASSAPA